MPWRDSHLQASPGKLPHRQFLAFLWGTLGVVIAAKITVAEIWVVEAILHCYQLVLLRQKLPRKAEDLRQCRVDLCLECCLRRSKTRHDFYRRNSYRYLLAWPYW